MYFFFMRTLELLVIVERLVAWLILLMSRLVALTLPYSGHLELLLIMVYLMTSNLVYSADGYHSVVFLRPQNLRDLVFSLVHSSYHLQVTLELQVCLLEVLDVLVLLLIDVDSCSQLILKLVDLDYLSLSLYSIRSKKYFYL